MRWFDRFTVRLGRRLGSGLTFKAVNAVRELWFYVRAISRGTFAQHGEDLFLLDYFGRAHRGTYVDVGASHPFVISNTYLLWKNGWRGVTVEPIPYLWQRHRRLRKGDLALNVGVGDTPSTLQLNQMVPAVLSTFDPVRARQLEQDGWSLREKVDIEVTTLADLYARHLSGKRVDLLSIDVEGWDLRVLKGNDWSLMAPRVVVCEVDSRSEQEIDAFLFEKGYRIARKLGCNRIYERADG